MLKLDFAPPDWDSPECCAKFFSMVDPENYLAHTIRKIEKIFYCLRKGKRYPVFVFATQEDSLGNALFIFDGCCYIRVRSKDIPTKIMRLCLAHELGHLVYDFSLADPPDESLESEVFSWIFAYYLIKAKSDEYKEMGAYQKFQYSDKELQDSIFALSNGNTKLKSALEKEFFKP